MCVGKFKTMFVFESLSILKSVLGLYVRFWIMGSLLEVF